MLWLQCWPFPGFKVKASGWHESGVLSCSGRLYLMECWVCYFILLSLAISGRPGFCFWVLKSIIVRVGVSSALFQAEFSFFKGMILFCANASMKYFLFFLELWSSWAVINTKLGLYSRWEKCLRSRLIQRSCTSALFASVIYGGCKAVRYSMVGANVCPPCQIYISRAVCLPRIEICVVISELSLSTIINWKNTRMGVVHCRVFSAEWTVENFLKKGPPFARCVEKT